MRIELTTRVSIEASAREVFRYLRDPKLHHLWNPHLQSITTDKLLQEGTEYETTSTFMGVSVSGTSVVTELLPNKRIQICSSGAALDSCVCFNVEKVGTMTMVRCVTEVTLTSKAFNFTQPVLRMLAKHEMQSDLHSLKIAVEQKLA
jgi:uncharacterized protein YndB with AHSA1/START domain